MSTMRDLFRVQREIREWVQQQLLGLFGWTTVASSDALGGDTTKVADDTDGQRPAQRIEPFGFRSRPPQGVRAFWIRIGSSNVAFIGIAPTGSYGPNDLDIGESAMYGTASGALVKIDVNGNIILTPTTGQTAQVAGSTYALPKWDDGASGGFVHALLTFLGNLNAAINITQVNTAASSFTTAIGTASNFSSTNAKNG